MSFYDIRYSFLYDNPFEKDTSKKFFGLFKKEIRENYRQFIDIDIYEDSFYLNYGGETKTIYGMRVSGINIGTNPIINDIKEFFKSIGTHYKSTETKDWYKSKSLILTTIDTTTATAAAAAISSGRGSGSGGDIIDLGKTANNETESVDSSKSVTNADDGFRAVPIGVVNSGAFKINSSLSYDFNGERLLDVDTIKRICINIAKAKLVKEDIEELDDLTRQSLAEKKHNLIMEIIQFKNVNRINASLQDEDINEMTIEQLEYLRDKCEELHKRFMIDEVIRSGFRLGSTGYDAIFPEGIPLGKRRIKFGGIGKQFREVLLDPKTTRGLSFTRILNKYHLSANDEFTIGVSLLEILFSNVHVESVATTESSSSSVSSSSSSRIKPKTMSNSTGKKARKTISTEKTKIKEEELSSSSESNDDDGESESESSSEAEEE
jgi:hypothetical protein